MSNDLVAQDLGMPTGIALRDPDVILEEAGERAKALTAMVERTKAFTQIGPNKHLRVEAWITVGQFYGCSARTTHTEDVSYNGVFGFKSHARVTHDATGQILTEAEALCMQDEKNWDSKPLHQLISMAQTRAISKALAMKFRWVVTLGGFAPTPAEEMTSTEGHEQGKPVLKAVEPPRFSYGKHKGKFLNDAEIDLNYLQWFADKTAEKLKDPARANFKTQDTLFLAALDAEIAHRTATTSQESPKQPKDQAKSDPGGAQGKKEGATTSQAGAIERTPFTESGWAEFVRLWEEEWFDLYAITKEAFGVVSGHDLPKEKRFAFYDQIHAAIATAAREKK